MVSKSGRGGGTYAHPDIAMEFASWISAEFKLYLIQDYKRLKSDETSKLSLTWNLHREISKINYKIHTDAIKTYLLNDLTESQLGFKYGSEADMLNVALFNKTAKERSDFHKILHLQNSPQISPLVGSVYRFSLSLVQTATHELAQWCKPLAKYCGDR